MGAFDDLIPAQPPQAGYPPQGQSAQVPAPYQAAPPQSASPDQVAAKMSFIQNYVQAGRGSYQDGAAAYDAAQGQGAGSPPSQGAPAASQQPPAPDPNQLTGYMLTPQGDAAQVASGAIPADHVRIDPTTGQRVFVGDPGRAAANAQAGYAQQPPQGSGGAPGGSGGLFDDLIPKPDAFGDSLRTLPGAIERGLSGIAGLPGTLANLEGGAVDRIADFALGNKGPPPSTDYAAYSGLPSAATLDQVAVRAAPGLGYQPQTWAGRLTNTAGEMAPGLAVGPEGSWPAAWPTAFLSPPATSPARRRAPSLRSTSRRRAQLERSLAAWVQRRPRPQAVRPG